MNVLEIAANMVRNAVDTMSSKFSAFVKDEINAKVSTLYKPGGAATLATLPALTADNAGYVYDMSEAFTTTANFREGAGHKYPAGTNVVISDVGGNVYKYDVLSGFLDGYVTESRKVGNVPLSADIPVTLTGDTAITVTNTGTASAIAYSVTHDDSGVTAGSKGDTTNQTPGFGGTFKVLSATVDAKGHVTGLGDHTVKVPNATATAQADGLMSKNDKAKLDTLSVTASNPLEVTKTGETYNVTLKDSGVTAGSKGDTTNQTPGFGGTFKVLSATVDAKGRVTSLAEHSVEIPNTTATTSAAGLMSATDKAKLSDIEAEANKTIIDATLSNTGQAADAKATGDSISVLRGLLSRMEIYCTASGNPATFSDAAAANVKALSVEIAATQSGSGDPYPPGGGKNLLNPALLYNLTRNGLTITTTGENHVAVSGTATGTVNYYLNGQTGVSKENAPYILPPGSYTYSVRTADGSALGVSGGFVLFCWLESSDERFLVQTSTKNRISVTLTAEETVYVCPSIYFDGGGTTNFEVYFQMESGSAATAYAPYANIRPIIGVSSVTVTRTGENGANSQSVTVTLTDGTNPLTVYGGTLDVAYGTLSVIWANIASYNGETLPGRWISDRDVYASGATPTTGAQVVYELATPLTYQLAPQQLATLSGYNSVSSDAGNVSVTYRTDPMLALGGG